MITSTILGLLIPFIGTSLGAACVLFMKNELSVKTTKMLSGFAAGGNDCGISLESSDSGT